MLHDSNQSPFSVRIAFDRFFFFSKNSLIRVIRVIRNRSSGKLKLAKFRVLVIQQILNFLDLISRKVGLNTDINISAEDFFSANYQHSQNLQTEYVDTLKQQNTRTEQETFEQLSLKMSHKHKFAAYIDDNCLR